MREHLEQRATKGDEGAKQAQAELSGPEPPEELIYLWTWWIELNRSRGGGMNGPEGLTYQGIDAWARLTGADPEPVEVEALFELDAAVREPSEPQAQNEQAPVRAWPVRKELRG